MAYFKRKIKNGKIQIGGEVIVVRINNVVSPYSERDKFSREIAISASKMTSAIWIQGWTSSSIHHRPVSSRSISSSLLSVGPKLVIEKNKDGTIPLYYVAKNNSTYFCIGEGRISYGGREQIETPADRPPLTYPMRFTREQWQAIEWAIDCGIGAATTQFSDDEETAALAPVLQSVLDEINGSKTEEQ